MTKFKAPTLEQLQIVETRSRTSDGILIKEGVDAAGRVRRKERPASSEKDQVEIECYDENLRLCFAQRTESSDIVQRFFDDQQRALATLILDLNQNVRQLNEYGPEGDIRRISKWSTFGRPLSEVEYLKNWKSGLEKIYDEETGQLISSAHYKEDKLSGEKKVFGTNNGQERLVLSENYLDGVLNGERREFHLNGNPKELALYQSGRLHGERIRFDESGKRISIQRFKNGDLDGLSEEFFAGEQIKFHGEFRAGKKHGRHETFNSKGQLSGLEFYQEGKVIDFDPGAKANESCIFEIYSSEGLKIERRSYLGGRPEGEWIRYREDLQVLEKKYFEKGVLSGKWEEFDDEGLPQREREYVSGRLVLDREFFPGSGVALERSWQLDPASGQEIEREFWQNGQPKVEVNRSADGLGSRQVFSAKGILLESFEFLASWVGEIKHGKCRNYDQNGDLRLEERFDLGVKSGESRQYSEFGRVVTEEEWQGGALKVRRFFGANSQLLREEEYFADGSLAAERLIAKESSAKSDAEQDQVTKTSHELRAGVRVGTFEIERLLGRGGMGAVFVAHDLELDRKVALKFLQAQVSEELKNRFLAEGRALARIQNPFVVAIYSVGQHHGEPFFAMEYVDGVTLQSVIELNRIGFDGLREIALGLLEGLIAAHSADVIHRDLKPANIVLNQSYSPKIIDFGISKVVSLVQQDQTAPQLVMGTPSYISPEVASGQIATAKSDIYSLGIVYFEMFTGERPFLGKTTQESLVLTREQNLPWSESAKLWLPPWLRELIDQMTQKDPALRLADLSQIFHTLKNHDFSREPLELRVSRAKGVVITNEPEVYERLIKLGFHRREIGFVLNLASHELAKLTDEQDQTVPTQPNQERVGPRRFELSEAVLQLALEQVKRCLHDRALNSISKNHWSVS